MSALGDAGMNRFLDRSSILLTSTKKKALAFASAFFNEIRLWRVK